MDNFSNLFESAVGLVGRTGAADAKAHVSAELRAEFKKVVKALGGKTVARQLLAEMNAGGPIEESSTFEKRAKEFYGRWNKGELPAKIFKTIKFTPAEKSRIEDRMNADNGNWSNI